jgi:hypothetical protein
MTRGDPFANLAALDLTELADLAESCMDLAQPFDDVPDFEEASTEVSTTAGLNRDPSHLRTPSRRLFRDYRSNPDAFKHLDTLPAEGESLHGVISGRYALWELVPAIIERTGDTIDELHLVTLSYGKQNAAELIGLLDGGQVKRCSLLVSYFFKAQNRHLYDTLVPHLLDRGHRVLAMRTHAKVTLARMASGVCYAIESSANLRSCKNVEQFVMTRDADLYRFHRQWVEELLAGKAEGEA